MNSSLPSTKILGIKITTASKSDILEFISNCIQKKKEKIQIVTPNPEILVYATRSSSFRDILNSAQVSLPDGIGVLLADKMTRKAIKARITGTDMVDDLCCLASERAFTVGFIGGSRGVAEKASECLREKYSDLIVAYTGEELDLASIKKHIDILFVAFGAPKQEEWIANNLADLPVTVAMGVGGALDYISGKVPRAPKLARSMGMEWAYRLVRQPWRIKRQLALPQFVYLVFKEKAKQ